MPSSNPKPVNRHAQKHSQAALERRLLGQKDPRGPVGIFSRGKNVYNAASSKAQQGGGPNFGRPKIHPAAIQRRLQRGQ